MHKNLGLLVFGFIGYTAIMAQEQVVLQDNFESEEGTFSVGDKGEYTSEIKDGHFAVKIKPNKSYWFTNYTDIDTKEENFTYEATIEQKKGSKSTYYGIVIGL